ncbi:MAG: head-tail connector protein [Pseudomonadota bacterium]
MILREQTQVSDAALPVLEFRDHLQLGSGFADDGSQDAVLITCLRAALAAVESDTGKAVYQRGFSFTVSQWRDVACQVLPVAPVQSLLSMTITDLLGSSKVIDPSEYFLAADYYNPTIRTKGWALPVIATGGTAEIAFKAGFGPEWDDVPADLAQAVLMLAAHFYENRSALADRAKALPIGVGKLLSRYRPVRLLGGRA